MNLQKPTAAWGLTGLVWTGCCGGGGGGAAGSCWGRGGAEPPRAKKMNPWGGGGGGETPPAFGPLVILFRRDSPPPPPQRAVNILSSVHYFYFQHRVCNSIRRFFTNLGFPLLILFQGHTEDTTYYLFRFVNSFNNITW